MECGREGGGVWEGGGVGSEECGMVPTSQDIMSSPLLGNEAPKKN